MKKYFFIFLTVLFFGCNNEVAQDPCSGLIDTYGQKAMKINSSDGLELDATIHFGVNNDFRSIALFHMAGSNQNEYCSIAARLTKLGYNCFTVDLRAGGDAFGGVNESHNRAVEAGNSTEYLEAYRDMSSAVEFLYQKSGNPVYVIGSSYSAGLAMKLAKQNSYIDKVAAFSPGEYYGEEYSLKNEISGLATPTFVTSSRKEVNAELEELISEIPTSHLTHFIPSGKGAHGSAVLWETHPDKEEYWNAFLNFIQN